MFFDASKIGIGCCRFYNFYTASLRCGEVIAYTFKPEKPSICAEKELSLR